MSTIFIHYSDYVEKYSDSRIAIFNNADAYTFRPLMPFRHYCLYLATYSHIKQASAKYAINLPSYWQRIKDTLEISAITFNKD